MAKLHAPQALISPHANLEYPVRVFAHAGIQAGATIGRYSYINRNSFIGGDVTMGRYCSIARSVDIGARAHHTHLLSTHPFQTSASHFETVPDYDSWDRQIENTWPETQIGHDVWIGSQTVITGGVTIGTGAVIGANSFVNADVPPYAVVVGSPARVLRYRFPPDVIERLLVSNWWDLQPADMQHVAFDDIETALHQIQDIHASQSRPAQDPLKKIQDTALQRQQATDLLLETDEFLLGLKASLADMMVPDPVTDVILKNAIRLVGSFDATDPHDQKILAHKLHHVQTLLDTTNPDHLSDRDLAAIGQVFRQKG